MLLRASSLVPKEPSRESSPKTQMDHLCMMCLCVFLLVKEPNEFLDNHIMRQCILFQSRIVSVHVQILSGSRKENAACLPLSLLLSPFPSLFLCFTPFLSLALNSVHLFSAPNS